MENLLLHEVSASTGHATSYFPLSVRDCRTKTLTICSRIDEQAASVTRFQSVATGNFSKPIPMYNTLYEVWSVATLAG